MMLSTRTLPLVSALALALAGCTTVGPNFDRLETAPAAGYAPASAPRAVLGESPAPRWWEAFGSPELDALVTRALANNRTVAASTATLDKARAHIAAVAGRELPQVDATAGVNHERVNLSAFGLDPSAFGLNIGNPEFTLYSLGGGVTYDLDLFGGAKRASEQARADAEAQRHEAEAAHLTVAGRVVLQALTIATLNERIAATQALLDQDARLVSLAEAKRKGGEGTRVEVLGTEARLATDRALLPPLLQSRAEARTMLAILSGISPAELGATDFTLASFRLPERVPVSLPSELAHRRPDILAAEARLHSATAAVGVATAKLYPNISIGATLQEASTAPGNLFTSGSTGFSLFGNLLAPIFHGGTLKAGKKEAEAEARAAAARYQQTVLEAFGQVSDLLSALGNDARAASVATEANAVATRSYTLAEKGYRIGGLTVVQATEANRTLQQARLGAIDVRGRQALDIARLTMATAGGFIGEPPAQASR